ncbi:MAG TPA: class I SAM-dependent methyltransferase [Candidatus Nitrosocosmicus sp.]|nr:class I SAM-dependent methyltransferase [Candidatus Nitrosocosmicus sp.]
MKDLYDPAKVLSPDRNREIDPIQIHYKNVFPYVYSAFNTWYEAVSSDPQIKEWLQSSDGLKLLKGSGNLLLQFGHGIPPEQLEESGFISEVHGVPPITSEFDAHMAIQGWFSLFLRKHWNDIHPDFPLVATIENPYAALVLPNKIKLGNYNIVKTFNKFYLPNDSNGSEKARALYNFLADEYENISDLYSKKMITDILFERSGRGLIFDVGCGTGLAQVWKPEDVTLFGIDISTKMAEKARERGEEVMVADLSKLTSSDIPYAFDGAIMSFVDHYFTTEEREKAYQLIFDCLKPCGIFGANIHRATDGFSTSYGILLEQIGFSKIEFTEETVRYPDGDRQEHFFFAQK